MKMSLSVTSRICQRTNSILLNLVTRTTLLLKTTLQEPHRKVPESAPLITFGARRSGCISKLFAVSSFHPTSPQSRKFVSYVFGGLHLSTRRQMLTKSRISFMANISLLVTCFSPSSVLKSRSFRLHSLVQHQNRKMVCLVEELILQHWRLHGVM